MSEANSRIRPDRKPAEFNKEAHILLHKLMISMGIKATRINSIFCTSRYSTAKNWNSNVYVVFPKDRWSASWIPGLSEKTYSFYKLANLVDKNTIDYDDYE